jgi:hypothetical protein
MRPQFAVSGAMFEDPVVRAAYRRGIRDAIEAGALHQPAAQFRELEQWMQDIDSWMTGEPPPPPSLWPNQTDD